MRRRSSAAACVRPGTLYSTSFRILQKKASYERSDGSGSFFGESGRSRLHSIAQVGRSQLHWYFDTSFLYLGASNFLRKNLKYALLRAWLVAAARRRVSWFLYFCILPFFLGTSVLFKKVASSSPRPVPKKKGRARPGRPEGGLSVFLYFPRRRRC